MKKKIIGISKVYLSANMLRATVIFDDNTKGTFEYDPSAPTVEQGVNEFTLSLIKAVEASLK